MSATETTPGAAATTGSPTSSVRFQSIALALGLWLALLSPVQDWPQGNGISKSLTGAADAGSVAVTAISIATGTGRTRANDLGLMRAAPSERVTPHHILLRSALASQE